MSTSEIAPLLSARVPTVTASRFKQYAKKRARSVNEVLSTAIEEWLRQEEFEYIEFRGTVDGTRIAYMTLPFPLVPLHTRKNSPCW